jgi:hypothetical protein
MRGLEMKRERFLAPPNLLDVDQSRLQHVLRIEISDAALFFPAGLNHVPHGAVLARSVAPEGRRIEPIPRI